MARNGGGELADSDGRRPPLQKLIRQSGLSRFARPSLLAAFHAANPPRPFSAPPLQKGPPMCTQKGNPFFFFSSFLFFLLFLLSPTFFLRKGRCVTFPPPDGNSCNDLLSFSSRSTCHICQPELFVVALGQRKKEKKKTTFTGSRRCWFSSKPAHCFSFFPLPLFWLIALKESYHFVAGSPGVSQKDGQPHPPATLLSTL